MLAQHVPQWADFKVAPCLLFLGLLVGPAATLEIAWRAPWRRCRQRARAVGDGVTSVTMSA
eukprot:2444648-Pyramimonas_sp.AAC.1